MTPGKICGAIALAVMGCAAAAHASPVTYDGTGGTVTITATDLTNPSTVITLSGNVLNLSTGTSSNVVFDSSVPDIVSFVLNTSGTVTVTSPVAFSGTTIHLSSVTATSTGTTPVTDLGGGNYQFTSGSASTSGSYSVNGGSSQNFSNSPTGLARAVGIGSDGTFGWDAVTLGTVTVDGQSISLKADIAFSGAQVPLPSAVWLLTSGLGLLCAPLLRRRGVRPT